MISVLFVLFKYVVLTDIRLPFLSAVMEVHVPEQPVVALHGRDVTLDCSFISSSSFNLSDLTVFWQLTDTKRSVHSYREGRDQLADQAERFANRTSLFPDRLGSGNASLLLSRVVVADEGSYTCFVRVQDYGSSALFLQVAGELLHVNRHILECTQNQSFDNNRNMPSNQHVYDDNFRTALTRTV